MKRSRGVVLGLTCMLCACQVTVPEQEMIRLEERLAAAIARSGLVPSYDDYDELKAQAAEVFADAMSLEARLAAGVSVEGSELRIDPVIVGPQPRVAEVTGNPEFAAETGEGHIIIPMEKSAGGVQALRRGLKRLMKCMDAHADNLANGTTTGFKRKDLHGRGDRMIRHWTQGALDVTERQLDLAIDGEGFFRVQLPGGEIAYTRAGNFDIDKAGNLVTAEGFLLDPQITIPEKTISITVDRTGRLFVIDPAIPEIPTEIGQFKLTRFINPSGLKANGDNLYLESEASGNPIDGIACDRDQGLGIIRQGFLEVSNVDVLTEYVDLMVDSRAAKSILFLLERVASK